MNEVSEPNFQRDEKLFNVQTDLHTLNVKCVWIKGFGHIIYGMIVL